MFRHSAHIMQKIQKSFVLILSGKVVYIFGCLTVYTPRKYKAEDSVLLQKQTLQSYISNTNLFKLYLLLPRVQRRQLTAITLCTYISGILFLPGLVGGLPGICLRILRCLLLMEKCEYQRFLYLANSVYKTICQPFLLKRCLELLSATNSWL